MRTRLEPATRQRVSVVETKESTQNSGTNLKHEAEMSSAAAHVALETVT